jgi:hypothetical protein
VGICTIGTNFFQTHTKKGGWCEFFYIKNTQKTILKTRLYELICSALSQPLLRHLCAFCFLHMNSYILLPKQKIAEMGLEAVGGRIRGDQTITPPTAAAASATLPRFCQPPQAWWCQQVARHQVGGCNEGLHHGRIGNDESLGM